MFMRGVLGALDAKVADAVVAAGGDVAMVIDREGVIRDIAVDSESLAGGHVVDWLDRRWTDTVTIESRKKVDAMLSDALSQGRSKWREVNQILPGNDELLVKFITLDAGRDERVIAIGRDNRAVEEMQQRLIQSQQSIERDYTRLRDAEFRYRLLFQMSDQAVLVVDSASRRIVEANPAAEALALAKSERLVGEFFAKVFDRGSQEDAASLLAVALSNAQTSDTRMNLVLNGAELLASASSFRQGRDSQCLVRLSPVKTQAPLTPARERLESLLERMPDALVVTDEAMVIETANAAFVELLQWQTRDQVIGRSLNDLLGRTALDRNLLAENLRQFGSVRNFNTVLRTQFDTQEEVDVSGVCAQDSGRPYFGFVMRRAMRRVADRSQPAPELRRSVEQLTELVGRVKLKELVRETTDLVERLCIEAALELTKDNRASAADMLGLSRQSLYSKLHRFGIVHSHDAET
jgi:transcriptional regulator PpsR